MGTVQALSRTQSADTSTAAPDAVRHDDARLANSRAPSGAASGSLAGTYPSPTIAAGVITGTEIAAAIKDPAAATAGLRTLGTGAAQAAAGNDSRLSDSRAPTGTAAGDLAGTYPNPTIKTALNDPAAATPGLRTLGTGAAQAAAGNHAHAGADITSGTIATARLPLVASPPYTLTYAATVTPDATAGNNIKITATGGLTIAVPTGGVDGQTLVFEVLASGANRVVTLNASIALTTGQSATYTIVSGKVGFIALRFSALSGNVWVCTSMSQEL